MADDDHSDPWGKTQRFNRFKTWWRQFDEVRAGEDLSEQTEAILIQLKHQQAAEKSTVFVVHFKKEQARDPNTLTWWRFPPEREPTLQELIDHVKAPGHDEVYAIFRKRDVSRLDDDRLPDVLDLADDIEDACKALLRVAGIDDVEAQSLGLDKFTGGNIMELCQRLGEITGDVYEVAPHERPKSRKPG